MKRNTMPVVTAGLSLLTVFAAEAALGVRGESNPCERSANQMYRACNLDIRDNLNVTLANCTNISDTADRKTCRAQARLARHEEATLCDDQLEARVAACDVLGEHRYDPDPLLDQTITFVDPDDIEKHNANPYVSVVAGHTFVLNGGEDGEEIVVVHVTDDSRDIQGVPCRVSALCLLFQWKMANRPERGRNWSA